jgi:general secretion pathway protein C
MSKLMTQIRVVPNFTDGQPDGFKIFAIRPGSLFAKIGLQNGDVLKRVNGVEIQGPEQAFEAYQRLKDETSIQIDLVRRNENKTLNYEVR